MEDIVSWQGRERASERGATENANNVCSYRGRGQRKTKSEAVPSGASIMALRYEHCSDLESRSTSKSNFQVCATSIGIMSDKGGCCFYKLIQLS
jgi:hypothetical protein